jgi:hypothetical protein
MRKPHGVQDMRRRDRPQRRRRAAARGDGQPGHALAQHRRPVEEARQAFIQDQHRDPQPLRRLLAEALAQRNTQDKDENKRHRQENNHGAAIAQQEAELLARQRADGAKIVKRHDHMIAKPRFYEPEA